MGEQLVSQETVVMTLLAIGVLFLLFWFIGIGEGVATIKDIETCRLSVLNFATFRQNVLGAGDYHLTDIDCLRRVVTFTEDHAEVNGKRLSYWNQAEEKAEDKYRALNGDVVNSVAASEMSICWYQFLEGKKTWTNGVDLLAPDTACFICGELHFEEETQYDVQPLFEFLKAQEHRTIPTTKRYPDEGRPKYFDYLYLEERICDHSRIEEWLLADNPSPRNPSCEEAFYSKLTRKTVSVRQGSTPYGVTPGSTNPLTVEVPHLLDPDLRLTPDNSYLILFYQEGEDVGVDETGQSTGTSYAPLIMRTQDFNVGMCNNFLG